MSLNLEQLLKASGQPISGGKPILEVNSHHPIVRSLQHETSETRLADWSHILFDQGAI